MLFLGDSGDFFNNVSLSCQGGRAAESWGIRWLGLHLRHVSAELPMAQTPGSLSNSPFGCILNFRDSELPSASEVAITCHM